MNASAIVLDVEKRGRGAVEREKGLEPSTSSLEG